ncbi:hypothetical protein [Burkholderia cepacia]|uniref:hypothetical protein n=1 Tax=Burkholderia cepacia TaxID=292 RepID=UPI002AB75F47|nr:hypothetical protein [Burkholderia cepacia]
MAGERLWRIDGVEVLAYYRRGQQDLPLIVFFPGGGHLARIAYGHAGADPRSFIDYWLEQAGYGLLALSYPGDHAVFSGRYPELTIGGWTELAARIANDVVAAEGLSGVLTAMGWSMAGRFPAAFAAAARERNMQVDCFVGLAASAPLPGLVPVRPQEPLTKDGLWDLFRPEADGAGRLPRWRSEISQALDSSGRPAVPADAYDQHYVQANPIGLRGERPKDASGNTEIDDSARAFSYAEFPWIASISPSGQSDARHALTDSAVWGAYNAQKLYLAAAARLARGAVPDERWSQIVTLARSLPSRLNRLVPGGHFFFFGAHEAHHVVQQVVELQHEVTLLTREIGILLE